MATSSGTEVGVEVEEEVEYVEEVVEYEDEEVVEEVEVEEEEEGEHPAPATSGAKGDTAEDESATEASEAKPEESRETVTIPPSSSAQELPELTSSANQSEPPAVEAQPAFSGPQPTSASGASHPGGSAGVDLDFKQLEAQAAKVAKEVSHIALDVSSKLTAGWRSAFGSTTAPSTSADTTAAAASGPPSSGGAASGLSLAGVGGAGASLTKLAGGLTSWWGSLDPAPLPVADETAERVAASNKASGELQQLFGLSPEENLVEHFKCKLLQTYACSHNPHTPAIQMAFQGTLYVTDRHTCFSVEERGRKVPFKVPHSQVVKATRQRPARKGDLSDVLKMELSNGQWLAFKDFESGSALDSALALVEHLMEGS